MLSEIALDVESTAEFRLADLQEELLGISDIRSLLVDRVKVVCDKYPDLPEADCFRNTADVVGIIAKECADPKALCKEIFGFSPIGPIDVKFTPFAVVFNFSNLVDWVRCCGFKKLAKGRVGFYNDCCVETSKGEVQVPVIALVALPGNILIHEIRHAIIEHLARGKIAGYKSDFDEDGTAFLDRLWFMGRETLIEELAGFIHRMAVYRLKHELAAFISQGVSGIGFKINASSYRFSDVGGPIENAVEAFALSGEEAHLLKEKVEKLPVNLIVKRCYEAVRLLVKKGYAKSWAVSYLTAGDHFFSDWLEVAGGMPVKV